MLFFFNGDGLMSCGTPSQVQMSVFHVCSLFNFILENALTVIITETSLEGNSRGFYTFRMGKFC